MLDQPQTLPHWAKKIGELWSTNKKVLVAHIDQPKWTFFWSHYAVLSSQIFTRITDWPRLPSPSPWGRGSPPKNFNRENLKFWLKIQSVSLDEFGASGKILIKVFQATWWTLVHKRKYWHLKCWYTVSWQFQLPRGSRVRFSRHSAGGVVARGISNT